MSRTAIRRGLAVAFSGMAMAGIVAVGQPASAAPGGGQPVASSQAGAPAPVAVPGASAASTASSRNGGGVSAQHLDGYCNRYSSGYGDLCLWYFRNFSGSHVDYYVSDSSFYNDTFNSPGAGYGQVVANNSESAFNYDLHLAARVFTGVNFTGSWGDVPPNTGGNFTSTFFNNTESLLWV